ncbi:DUF805 domain-containing protein [Periweissella cryptocerci]|uniref:DUF805 domain-containing protein n=1 Tax=Periweissella cryptocerci TaxID=2506420 RepID=A0A4P6YVG7_9LACO|nr:DUF805 domain-containing protein [Periweissella cryptocerci]QBO36794.1 DUF805 domain-containing protein [Periweissella cryptocerci]
MSEEKEYIDHEYESGIKEDDSHSIETQLVEPAVNGYQQPTLVNPSDAETSLIPATKQFFTHAFDFTSRATRGDFWWGTLGLYIIGAIISVVFGLPIGILFGIGTEAATNAGVVVSIIGLVVLAIFGLALALPTIARSVRRLRDVDMPPLLGLLWLLGDLGGLFFFVVSLIPTALVGKKTRRQTEFTPEHLLRNWLLYGAIIIVVVGGIAALIAMLFVNVQNNPEQISTQLNNL